MIRLLRNMGVRGRLLIAFLGISTLAVLGAVTAFIAFHDVDLALDRVTRERVPAGFAALELSRQAERITAAGPRLLAAGSAVLEISTKQEIREDLARMEK